MSKFLMTTVILFILSISVTLFAEDPCKGKKCGHGKCVNGECDCEPGYKGRDCKARILCANAIWCQYGTCRKGKCECDSGFLGDSCDKSNPHEQGESTQSTK